MTDQQTIAVYDAQIEKYKKVTQDDETNYSLAEFEALLNPNSLVLDLGCGLGIASAYCKLKGHRVDPIDASIEMVRAANELYDVGARQATFDDISQIEHYDGVWANFSLLHASPTQMPRHLSAIATALKPNGVFHIGMKLKTDGNHFRDKIGRLYSYYLQDELNDLLVDAGFSIEETYLGEGVGLAGDMSPWIVIHSRKAS